MLPDTTKVKFRKMGRPFLRIENHLVHIDRIISIEFLPNGLVNMVDDVVWYHEDLAENDASLKETHVKKLTVPIVVITYSNKEGTTDYIRRHGQEAVNLWNYVTLNLSVP